MNIAAKITQLLNSPKFQELTAQALAINPWNTPYFINYASKAIQTQLLDPQKIENFKTKFKLNTQSKTKNIGIIAAGNLPLVGFADTLYALLLGYKVTLKPSSKDPLMRIFEELPEVTICNTIEELSHCSAILAMGSDSTCSLIKKLYPATPTLLRGSMHSIAIITGDETPKELELLCDDMLLYAARGCRNVTHLYTPCNYDFSPLIEAINRSIYATQQLMPKPWLQCYRQQKALLKLKGAEFIDSSLLLITPQATNIASTITYSYYNSLEDIKLEGVQFISKRGAFGCGQLPSLEDFANNENVPQFLSKIEGE